MPDLREIQKPLKEKYRTDPSASRITLKATGAQTDTPLSCSVDLGRAIYAAEAHKGVGGSGVAGCSGDLLLGALAACAQLTCQMVATATNVPTNQIQVTVEGDLDLSGTLGVNKSARVGFEQIRISFEIDAPQATAEEIGKLKARTEQYCVVLQTLLEPPPIDTKWSI